LAGHKIFGRLQSATAPNGDGFISRKPLIVTLLRVADVRRIGRLLFFLPTC
jgi:hypothetical protein